MLCQVIEWRRQFRGFWEGFMRKRRDHFVVGLLATVGITCRVWLVCCFLQQGSLRLPGLNRTRLNQKGRKRSKIKTSRTARNKTTGKPDPAEDPAYRKFGIYENTAPRAARTAPVKTSLPLEIPSRQPDCPGGEHATGKVTVFWPL